MAHFGRTILCFPSFPLFVIFFSLYIQTTSPSPWDQWTRPMERAAKARNEVEDQFIKFLQTMPRLWGTGIKRNQDWRIELSGAARRQVDDNNNTTSNYTSPNSTNPEPPDCWGYGIRLNESETINACGSTRSCKISELTCGGEAVDPSNYLGPVRNCTLTEIDCEGGSNIPFASADSCSIYQLLCLQSNATNTTEILIQGDDLGNTNLSLSSCRIRQIFCATTSVIYDLPPDPNDTCTFAFSPSDPFSLCADPCIEQEVITPCICPYDRQGDVCQYHRPYDCSFRLISPVPHCETPPLLDSDPVCFRYYKHETVTFTYQVNCWFTNTTGLDVSFQYQELFTYFAIKQNSELEPPIEFAISDQIELDAPFEARFKIWNFNIFSDYEATVDVLLFPNQVIGAAPVEFPVRFAGIPDRFYAGDRLYYEVTISPLSSTHTRDIHPDRRFIDVHDPGIERHYSEGISSETVTWIIVGSIVGFFVLLTIGYWLNGKIQAWREDRRLKRLQAQGGGD